MYKVVRSDYKEKKELVQMKTGRRKWYTRWIAVCVAIVLGVGICEGLTVCAAYENTHTNTGNQRIDIVEVAKTQIGYHEGSLEGTTNSSNNYTKYNVWNGKISGYGSNGYGYAWCHAFVSWCANQAGIGTDIVPKTAGTSTGRSFFVNQGTYRQSAANGGSYVPQAGDIIYYGSGSSPSHVGIVSDCDGSTVYTIEGNYSNKVGTRAINLSNSYIIGYGVPNYKGVNPNPDPIPTKWYDEYSLADVGTDFCAYIINTEAWKHITNESNNNVIMHNENGYAEQIWRFTKNADGSYKIINCKTGCALDRGGSDNNVYVSPDCGNDYQSWYIYGESGAYFFKPRNSDNVMDISGGSVEDGANVGMFEWNGTTAQKFQIWKLDTWTNLEMLQDVGTNFHAYLINTEAWKNIVNESDDNVAMHNDTKSENQIWKFIRKDDGSYKILNCKTGKALDWNDKNGNVYVNSDYNNDFQSWYIFGESGAYFLKPKNSNKVLDITSGSVNDGANVQIYDWNGTTAQKFQIWKLDYTPILLGDLNSDNKITSDDLFLLQSYLTNNITLTESQGKAADLNEDGLVDGFDLALLRQKLA